MRAKVSRTINQYLTIRNWLIGYYIVEFEQNGEDRAQYGDQLINSIAEKLKNIKGIDRRSLFRFRQFYLYYPHLESTIREVTQSENNDTNFVGSLTPLIEKSGIVGSLTPQSHDERIAYGKILFTQISYTHIEQFLSISDPLKRKYYEIEYIKGTWSVRELKRQINSLSFERSAVTKNPELLSINLSGDAERLSPDQIIKTPYVFDFLGLPDTILGSESNLEQALIQNLKNFILEMGHGFCFEAQQKRIILGGEYFFIDLVFYHRILKCHVLIELKDDAFTHANAGQLNTYIQYYKENIRKSDDRETIGILLVPLDWSSAF